VDRHSRNTLSIRRIESEPRPAQAPPPYVEANYFRPRGNGAEKDDTKGQKEYHEKLPT